MEDFGLPKLDLVFLVLLAWIIVYFCIWKGVKSTGKVRFSIIHIYAKNNIDKFCFMKVVYVTAVFPYIVLIIILIRGVTLEGASIGLKYFLVPKWEDLLKPSVIKQLDAEILNINNINKIFSGLG